jgi:hypothetical protein
MKDVHCEIQWPTESIYDQWLHYIQHFMFDTLEEVQGYRQEYYSYSMGIFKLKRTFKLTIPIPIFPLHLLEEKKKV